MPLGQRRPAGAPDLALPGHSVLYGGVVHRAEASDLGKSSPSLLSVAQYHLPDHLQSRHGGDRRRQ